MSNSSPLNQLAATASRLLQASSGNEREPSDVARDAVFMFLAASAGLFAMVASVYLATLMMDSYGSFCCPGVPGNPEDFDHGRLARKAGLWGLTLVERRQILNYLFKGSKELEGDDVSTKPPETPVEDDIESQKRELPTRRTSSKLMDSSVHSSSVYSKSTAQEEAKEEPLSEAEQDIPQDQTASEEFSLMDSSEHDRNACSICLSSFRTDEVLMSGTNCDHTFHRECLFDWLMKPHDECPYCRKDICSPDEMRRAAGEVLGSRRLNELTRWAPPIPSGDVPRDPNGIPDPIRMIPDPLRSPPAQITDVVVEGEAATATGAAYAAGVITAETAATQDQDESNETEADGLADLEAGISAKDDDRMSGDEKESPAQDRTDSEDEISTKTAKSMGNKSTESLARDTEAGKAEGDFNGKGDGSLCDSKASSVVEEEDDGSVLSA